MARKYGTIRIRKRRWRFPTRYSERQKLKRRNKAFPLRQFVTEAVEERLKATTVPEDKPWMQMVGGLRHLRKETARIMKIIDEEFETIEPEDWK